MTTRLYVHQEITGTEVDLNDSGFAVVRFRGRNYEPLPADMTVNTGLEARELAQAFLTAAGLLERGNLDGPAEAPEVYTYKDGTTIPIDGES